MTPQLADQICLWSAAIIPIALIVVFRWRGVLLGTIAVWGILLLAGVWISALDPARDGGVLDSLWLLFGWLGGLLYCLPILGVREALAFGMRRYRSAHRGG